MSVTTIPDIERTLGDYLRDHGDITALGARVAGQLPKSFTRPWIRVTQLDAREVSRPMNRREEHLINFFVQLDVYAGSEPVNAQADASELARVARAVLCAMPDQTFYDLIVTDVMINSHARIPDLDFDPPRERYVVAAEIYAHAISA